MSTEFHEKMSQLFKDDLEGFERERKRLVEDLIDSAPDHLKLKLRALQAKFDGQMRKAGPEENRLAFAQNMMLDKFLNEFNPTIQKLSKELNKLPSTTG